MNDPRVDAVAKKRAARIGWAKAAQLLAAEGDDELVWPEFSNEADSTLMSSSESVSRLRRRPWQH